MKLSFRFVIAGLTAALLASQAYADPPVHHHKKPPPPPEAKTPFNMAGCGLGSIAVQDPSKWAQVGAAFLNGTGFQTFAITFGTSNCTEDGVAEASKEKNAFIEANLPDLQRDIAVGAGESLSSLASLYGCKGTQEASFDQALRKHQDAVLHTDAVSAPAVIDSVVAQEKASCQG